MGGMKVYISHSRRDGIVASTVARIIEQGGHEPLVDRGELTPGVDFGGAIQKMIDDADAVLVIWTDASVMSDWIRAEAQRALDLGKYLGVTVGDVELPLRFRVYNHLRLEPRGSDLRPEMILSALEDFSGRLASPRAASQAAQSAKRRAATPPPPPIRPQEELEIPAFLRREPAAAGEAPAVEQAAAPQPAPVASVDVQDTAVPAERGYDVFISYSRKDTDACKLAFNLMAERGLVPWYDKDIGGGAFKQKIVTRISGAPVFVLLLSKHSVGSQNVSKELSVASSSGRLIIPISIDGITPAELADTFRYELIELNIFNADPKVPESWSDVIKTVADGVAEVRTEAGAGLPVPAPVQPLGLAAPVAAGRAGRPPVLFAGLTVVSGVLQQAAVGFALWRSGAAGVEVAAAVALASGAVIWPLTYGAALLARLAFRRSAG